jgi:hypothetical protein
LLGYCVEDHASGFRPVVNKKTHHTGAVCLDRIGDQFEL